MSIDPETFDEMFAAAESDTWDDFLEPPPVREELIEPPIRPVEPPVRAAEPPIRPIEPPVRMAEPPIRRAEPPPSKQEIEAAAAEELLKIAAEEEQDVKNVRKELRSKDTFVIHCPKGCRIRVKEQHRGRAGRCPRCQSEFVVPSKK